MFVDVPVLYLACTSSGEPKSQAAIADAAGVSEVTLRKNQRLILEKQEAV